MLFLVLELLAIYAFSRALWRALQKRFNPSVMDNLRGPEPSSLVAGNMAELHDKHSGWAFHKEITTKFGGAMKIKGMFGEDQIFVSDPKAMHHIFVKDQHIYDEAPFFTSFNRLSYGEGLLGTLGEQHRKQRKMLNPVFSIAHMRDMVPLFYDVTRKLQRTIASKVDKGPQEIDLVSWMTRTALELIGQAGLGYSFDTLEGEEPTQGYSAAARGFMGVVYKLRFVAPIFTPLIYKYGNPKLCRFIMDLLPYKALHEARDIIDLMHETSRKIFAEKKQALLDGDEALKTKIGQGKDIMSILMRANMTASAEDGLTEDELIGQMSTLTFAAMDTTSNALSRVLHLLALHPHVQERMRSEIVEAKRNNGGSDIPYDDLVHLPYLDAVCRETLRVYAPVAVSRRITMQDVVLPLANPVQGIDGREISEIPLPKDTELLISLISSNINPEIWGSDADEWKPERWLSPLPESVKEARVPGVYSHLMTFIGGGRSCIYVCQNLTNVFLSGFKFSQLEMKVVLCLLVEAFRFSLPKDEIIWEMNAVASPMVKGRKSNVPVLPLVVERV